MRKILIIGGGVAGCSLAWQLSKKGVRVKLLDKKENKSSFVAAGIINPMVFRRMNLSWRADEFLPYALAFYGELEKEMQEKFCVPLRIRRFFSSQQERNFWQQKQELKEYQDFLTHYNNFDESIANSKGKHGSALVKKGFRVDSLRFMTTFHRYLIANKILEYSEFNSNEFNPETLTYQTVKYDFVVFCCGSDNYLTPYFRDIKIEHTKGQMITVESNEINEQESWNHKGFLLPIGNNRFKVGATIEREVRDTKTTPAALKELRGVLENLTNSSYTVIKQVAGIRPTVYDRRPVMGQHPNHDGLYIFNGLGTKGYLMAPLLSEEMASFIMGEKPLHREVQLARFYKNKS